MKRFTTLAIVLSVAAPAFPQSLPNLALANLNYTVRKRTVNPQGELKEKIDQNDREMKDNGMQSAGDLQPAGNEEMIVEENEEE